MLACASRRSSSARGVVFPRAWASAVERSRLDLAGALVLAAAADAVMLLGEVDDLEIVRERARHPLRIGHVERRDGLPQRRRRLVPRGAGGGAPALGESPDALFEIEERLALLLDERLAENVAERRHVAAQRLRGV